MSCYASKSFGIMILMGSKLIPVSTGELLLLFPHVVAPLMSIISGVRPFAPLPLYCASIYSAVGCSSFATLAHLHPDVLVKFKV